MKLIQLLFEINDDLTLKAIHFEYNDTGEPSDKKLLCGLANAILTDTNMEKIVDDANKIINP